MVWDRLFGGAKKRQSECYVGEKGYLVRIKNPLPNLFPALFDEKPHDDFARREDLRKEMLAVQDDILFACHMPRDQVAAAFQANLDALLEVPALYNHLVWLKGKGLERFYANHAAVATLFQMCLLRGQSDMIDRLQEDMMLCLLGVFFRQAGLSQLSPGDRDILCREHRWDLSDARQKDLRDQFLEQYGTVADRLARLSAEWVTNAVGEKHQCGKDRKRALLHVVRYSWRIHGRTAARMKDMERDRVHSVGVYLSLVHSIASAWAGQKKRFPQILAEEWGRVRSAVRHQKASVDNSGLGVTVQALSDIIGLCRCQVLTNFQGRGRDAVYSPLDNVLVKEVPVAAELKDGSERSVRRFLKADASEGGLQREDGDPPRRLVLQSRWQCFRPERKINVSHRNLMESLHKKRGTSSDPPDAELHLLDVNEWS